MVKKLSRYIRQSHFRIFSAAVHAYPHLWKWVTGLKSPNYKGKIIAKRKAFTYWMLQHKPNMENFHNQKIVFSMAGYVIAASMMEKVTGKSWEELLTGICSQTDENFHGLFLAEYFQPLSTCGSLEPEWYFSF